MTARPEGDFDDVIAFAWDGPAGSVAYAARLLLLDAALAASLAVRVGQILEQETGLAPQVDQFIQLTHQYLCGIV